MSTEKKLTAVEWLVENTPLCKNDFYLDKINEAKELEKKQIIDAVDEQYDLSILKQEGEQYYEETYKKD